MSLLSTEADATSNPATTNFSTLPGAELSANNPTYVVALEGLIGVGKSSLAQRAWQAHGSQKIEVYKERPNQHLLGLFYADPAKYGFALQMTMLSQRHFQWQLAMKDKQFGRGPVPVPQVGLWDRSMLGDYVFALCNHLLGNISRAEMDAYENMLGGSVNDIASIPFVKSHAVDTYVFLWDTPRNCKRRTLDRKNPYEEDIPLEYYEMLDDVHFAVMLRLMATGQDVLVMHYSQFEGQANISEAVAGHTRGSIVFSDLSSGSVQPRADILYTSTDDIITGVVGSYAPGAAELPRGTQVLISYDCMSDHITKSTNPLNSRYDLPFFVPAFKQRIMEHLALGHHIRVVPNRKHPGRIARKDDCLLRAMVPTDKTSF